MTPPEHHDCCRAFLYQDFPGEVQKRRPGDMHLTHWKRHKEKGGGGWCGVSLMHPPRPANHGYQSQLCPIPGSHLPRMVRQIGWRRTFFIGSEFCHHFSYICSPSCCTWHVWRCWGRRRTFILFVHYSFQYEKSILNMPTRVSSVCSLLQFQANKILWMVKIHEPKVLKYLANVSLPHCLLPQIFLHFPYGAVLAPGCC